MWKHKSNFNQKQIGNFYYHILKRYDVGVLQTSPVLDKKKKLRAQIMLKT